MSAPEPDPVLARKQLARRLLGITEEMLRAARREDWAAVAEGQLQRQAVAGELFASPVPQAAADTVAYCLTRVLALDPELSGLVQTARDAAGAELGAVRTGRRAMDAYSRFSR